MLKSYLYLNEVSLNGYISALEDGLRSTTETREKKSSSGKAKAGLAAVGGEFGGATERETSHEFADTAESRFERFLRSAKSSPDLSGWVDIVDADTDMQGVGVGTIFEFDCEIFVPAPVRALSSSSELPKMLGLLEAFSPFMPESTVLPPTNQTNAIISAAGSIGGDLVVVGERDDSDWRVAGKLRADSIRNDELDGAARVVGKVISQLSAGEYKSLLAIPGMNLMSREQRRAQAKAGPTPGSEASWLEGPAVFLEVLAIFR